RFKNGSIGEGCPFFEDSKLPASYDECLPESAFGRSGPRKAQLGPDHPLVAVLAVFDWPKNRRQHAAFMCGLADARKLRVGDAASLLGLSKGRFTLLRGAFR